MDDLKDIRSLIVPLFFVPMGRLKDKDWFTDQQMNELHRELLIKCLQHDLKWVRELIRITFCGKIYNVILRFLYDLFVKIIEYKARKPSVLGKPVISK